MLYVWYIYPHNWVIFGVNGGKYSIHGAYGIYIYIFHNPIPLLVNTALLFVSKEIKGGSF